MIKFSRSTKVDYVMTDIFNDLQELGTEEVKRYKKEFPFEIDYNLFMYGNLRIYNYDIMELFKKAGYKVNFEKDTTKYVELYKALVGRVAREYFK